MARRKLSKVKTAVKQYVLELKNYGIKPTSIILYGSYASGTATEASDIDIVVISSDLSRWRPLERLKILSRATLNIDAPLEVLGYTPKEIKEKASDSIFWGEISQTGREIYKKTA